MDMTISLALGIAGLSFISFVASFALLKKVKNLEDELEELKENSEKLELEVDELQDHIQDLLVQNTSDDQKSEANSDRESQVEGSDIEMSDRSENKINAWKSRSDRNVEINTEEQMIQFLNNTISVIKGKLLEVNSNDPEKKDMINNLFGLITSQTERLASREDSVTEDPHELSKELLRGAKSYLKDE